MKIAYVTTDEVNRYMAKRLARAYGLKLSWVPRRDAAADGQFDAIIYDLDYLPAEEQVRALAALVTRPLSQPAAVHSYHLEKPQKEALRANGVAVYRRLVRKLFRVLLRRCRQAHACQGLPLRANFGNRRQA
jgi:hypothetical protein